MGSRSTRLGGIRQRVRSKVTSKAKATGTKGSRVKPEPELLLKVKVKVMTPTIGVNNARIMINDERVITMIGRAGLGIATTTTTSTVSTTATTPPPMTAITMKGLLMIMTGLGMGWVDLVRLGRMILDGVEEERIKGITIRARERTAGGGRGILARGTGESS